MTEFNLELYVSDIVKMAEKHECDASSAVDKFITNLTTMSDYNSGAENLNFRALGQKWNALTSKTRNSQRAKVVAAVQKKVLPGRHRLED